jgi:hypothetical protein
MDVYVERDFQWNKNHRLSAQSRIAKARKVSPGASRGETHASNERLRWPPWACAKQDRVAQWINGASENK